MDQCIDGWRDKNTGVVSRTNPPPFTVFTGGTEVGEKQGEVHLQLAAEYWDWSHYQIGTVSKHLKQFIQPLLDSLIKLEDGEAWHALRLKWPRYDT